MNVSQKSWRCPMRKKGIQSIYHYWLDWKFSTKIISALFNIILCTIAVLVIVNYLTNNAQAEQELGAQFTMLADQTLIRAAEKVEEGTKLLETLAKTPSIIAAVKEANTKRANWTAGAIVQQDRDWINGDPAIQLTLNEISENAVSDYLIDFRNHNPEEAEIFITDQRGLNIAMTSQTSDFFQADEDWWTSTYANGKGAQYFGAVEYDESSKAYAMQIGILIVDPETNKVIGVMRGSLDIS